MFRDFDQACRLWRSACDAYENQRTVMLYAAVNFVQEWVDHNVGDTADGRVAQYGSIDKVLANPLHYGINGRNLEFLLTTFNLGPNEHDKLIERLEQLDVKLPDGLRLAIRGDVRQWHDQGEVPQKCLAITNAPADIESFLDA